MEVRLLVPLYCYLDTAGFDVVISDCIYGSTSKTIKISFKNCDKVFYGVYPDLPNISYDNIIKMTIPAINNGHKIVDGNQFKKIANEDAVVDKFNGIFKDGDCDLYFASYTLSVYDGEVVQMINTFIQDFKDKSGYESVIANNRKYISKEKEGQSNMANNLFGDIRVGKAGSKYTLTYFGTVAYNGKTYYQGKIFDATGMTINFDMLYMIPTNEVKKGDIIEKGNKAYYVLEVNSGVVKAVDLVDGTEENLVPGGVFGMTMYSKIFNPMGNMSGDNSFGNMLMMQALMGDGDSGNGNNGMLLAMMMMQGGFKFPTFEMPKFPEAESNTESKK